MKTLRLIGDSSIPVILLIPGAQLAGANPGSAPSEVGVIAVLKMVVASATAIGVVLIAGFGGPTIAWTFVLKSAMPAAVTPLILVVEFGNASGAGSATLLVEFVSVTVFATTLPNVPALSVLIYLLNHGFAV